MLDLPVRIAGVDIGEELGHGAYSVVYRARQGDTRCALKVPRVRGKWTRWVYREAVALARARHPGLPRILEVGEADDLPYLLMELVEGETLAERLLRGALPLPEAIEIGCQLAEALRAVHEVGLVHRDVKPRNVILERAGRVRLVDFGFAAPAGAIAAHDAAGTRRYSAPEQFLSPDRVDARADLYALGRVLFECLSGRPADTADVARTVVALLDAAIPAPVSRLIAGLVAESPADRYPDAVAVLAELHRVRAGGTPRGPAAFEPTRAQGPLVGRDVELERFVRSWREVERSGGRVIFVEGVRGSGKTRFLQACAAKVVEEGRGRVLESVCRQGDAPLSAIRQIFESYLASLRRLPPPERAAALTALRASAEGPLAPLARLVAPAFTRLLAAADVAADATSGATAAAMPDAFAEGAAELIVRLARLAGPLLLSVDDLQWTDPASLDVLAAVAHRAHEVPLLLVAAARTSEAAPPALARFGTGGSRHWQRVTLGPLDVRQSSALIAAHLGVSTVEPALVRRVVSTADDTPVGVLEVLGAYLDAGALRLRGHAWRIDAAAADRVTLPRGSLALLGRRVAELPPATRRVLEVAAILGTAFDEGLLAEVLEIDRDSLGYALGDGRRAGLLQDLGGGRHAFCHDSVRETLAGSLDEHVARRWHQRAAECLVARTESNPDLLYACAAHFEAGEVGATPALAYRVARKAAEGAFARFDNDTALSLFRVAGARAADAGLPLDAAFHQKVGEVHLRVGALDQSLRAFEAALALATEPTERAAILGRIAWVRRARSEPDEAWAALDRAFGALGVPMPTDQDADAAPADAVAPWRLERGGAREVLFELFHQHARLGIECRMPLRSLRSTLQFLALAGEEGPSQALARAQATYGAVLGYLGRRAEADERMAVAEAMAAKTEDPSTIAFCLSRRAVALLFLGQLDAALGVLTECAEQYGPWLELAQFCDTVLNGDFVESIRGRAAEAWRWSSRAIDRLTREQRAGATFPAHVVLRARAALATLGRDGQLPPALMAGAGGGGEAGSGKGQADKAFYRMACWGPQARFLLEAGHLGDELEDLVRRFEAEGHDPAASHPALVEYYIAVAHARIHQCLRSGSDDRAAHVAALRKAAADLRAAARLPLYRAHAVLACGVLAWLEGKPPKAERLLARAEALARRETCPWVLWGVARARAHMLRAQGKPGAARDQARIAEALADEHGAEARARLVREELSLSARHAAAPGAPSMTSRGGSSSSSSRRSSKRARRQLASLLHIARTPHGQLRREQHAAALVDELVRELAAERAFLLFEPNGDARGRLALGRTRFGETLGAPEGWRERLVREAMSAGDDWASPPDVGSPGPEPLARQHVLAVPLLLHDRVVGAVCVERGLSEASFAPDDRELLIVLAHQVPLALELERLLEERDQLQASFQQIQKMEVVGQLAGSVAHDVNNMLHLIQAGQNGLEENPRLDDSAREDLRLIAEGLLRARQLTAKLLAFSRQQPLPLVAMDLNRCITNLQPLLRGLANKLAAIRIELRLDPDAHHALTDEASLDQALVNLAVNARDAMPGGGTLTISTRNVVLGSDAVRRGAPGPGDYVVVEVADTGHGIPPEVLPRIFDPFFTTKPVGKGTGLGLSTVFAFVRKCGGFVEVSSEVGRGTTFCLYFPRTDPIRADKRPAAPRPAAPLPAAQGAVPAMILVVDDDPNIRELTRVLLEDGGYRVQTASGASDALRVAQSRGKEIALVILDMNMPDMSGPELRRRLADLKLPAEVLFVSGCGAHVLADGTTVGDERLLQKPFTSTDLLGRVRTLLSA